MKKPDHEKEVERRTGVALAAIRGKLGTDDSGVDLFISHHLEELDAAYWKQHTGTPQPDPKQVIDLLELRSHWSADDADGLDAFDFTLPDGVTDYIISVRFDESGEVSDIDMES